MASNSSLQAASSSALNGLPLPETVRGPRMYLGRRCHGCQPAKLKPMSFRASPKCIKMLGWPGIGFPKSKKNMIAYLCISHVTLFSCSRFVLMNDLLLPIEIIVSPWLSIPQHENPRPKPRPPSHVCAMDGGA